jgi:hypothetical protein
MATSRLIPGLALLDLSLLVGGAGVATGRCRLHYASIVCRRAPCPDWRVTDRDTHEQFMAVVDFSPVGGQPPEGPADLLVEGRAVQTTWPGSGASYPYTLFTVIRITGRIAAEPVR